MLKLFNFTCPKCDEEWEDLIADQGASPCPLCMVEYPRDVICAPKLALFQTLPKEEKARQLRKRSSDHTQRELKKEPEKFGNEGIKRARSGQIRVAGGLGKSK